MSVTLDGFDLVFKKTDASGKIITDMRYVKDIQIEHHREVGQITTVEKDTKKQSTKNEVTRKASTINVEGEIIGGDASQGIGELQKKFRDGKTIEFVSQLALASGRNKFVIKELKIDCVKGGMSHFKYTLRLLEDVQLESKSMK